MESNPRNRLEVLRSKIWRLTNLYWIKDKNRRKVKLKFNRAQQRIVNQLLPFWQQGRPLRHLDFKARQIGASTLLAIIHLDDTVFHRNTTSGIVAQQRSSLNHIWEIVHFAHANMHSSIRPELKQDTTHALAFKDLNSKVFVDLRVQSTKLDNLHISEYPLCYEEDIRQTLAACTPTANVTFEGVANGMNHAYHKYNEMKKLGLTLFHPWFLQEEYRIPTYGVPVRRTIAELDMAKIAQSDYGIKIDDEQILYRRKAESDYRELFPALMAEDDVTCFLTSGNPFFNNRKMEVLLRKAQAFLSEHKPETGDSWEMWERPQSGHVYASGVDVAEGIDVGGDQVKGGRDYSVLTVLCANCRKQAFRYRARVGVDAFYRVCDKWSREYNTSLLGVERNNHGHAVILGLRESCKYPNLYAEGAEDTAFAKSGGSKKELRYGWETNAGNKALVLEQFRQAIEGKFEEDETNFSPEIEVLDGDFLAESFTFKNVGGKMDAESGCHDDLIMAWSIAYQMYLRVRSKMGIVVNGSQWHMGGELESSKIFGGGPRASELFK